jgi:hypothetical protein
MLQHKEYLLYRSVCSSNKKENGKKSLLGGNIIATEIHPPGSEEGQILLFSSEIAKGEVAISMRAES